MRTFVMGSGEDRRIVRIEVQGRRMAVATVRVDGSTKRSEKELASEAEATAAVERMAREVVARGYVEHGTTPKPKPARRPAAAPVSPRAAEPESVSYALTEALDDDGPESGAPVLTRMARSPAAATTTGPDTPKKKKKKKRSKKKGGKDGESTDWVAIGGITCAAALLIGAVGYLFSGFFVAPTLVGTWQGSQVNYEVGKSLTYDHYRMTFNDQGRVSMILQKEFGRGGTYRVEGNRLTMDLVDEYGETEAVEYGIELGRSTLTLLQPDGSPLVKLIRLRETDVVPGPNDSAPGAEAVAEGDIEPMVLQADPALAVVDHVSKDQAFSCKYPRGWDARDGSRPDNTYSWAEFTKGSGKVRIDADIKGSLLADIQNPGGAPADEFSTPPVATAHADGKRTAAEGYSEYQEGPARPFTTESLGEGRIAEFTAAGSGLFGSPIHGYRATLLTNNRRLTVLCECPEEGWAGLQPTFQAVIQSLSR